MKHTFQEKRKRNWIRLSLIHTRSRLITVVACLTILGVLSTVSLIFNGIWPGTGIWVWGYAILCFSASMITPFFAVKSISKNLHTEVVDITTPQFRDTYHAMRHIAGSTLPQIKFHWGSKYTFMGLISSGLPFLPMHLVVSGISDDTTTYKEFVALLAHEFGHFRLGNILILNFIRAITLGPMVLSLWIGQLTPFGNKISQKWPWINTPHQLFTWAMALVLVPLALILFYVSLILTWIFFSPAQYFEEYTADSNAYAIQGSATHMVTILNKLYGQATTKNTISPLNWFWIVESNAEKFIYNVIAWYPSLSRRIKTLHWLEGL